MKYLFLKNYTNNKTVVLQPLVVDVTFLTFHLNSPNETHSRMACVNMNYRFFIKKQQFETKKTST
ncbi:hypothetical protein, partial [Paenibacillus polymyxa]|uniref:hypothetical protein n=1 Tax=Paenibacillus polymyxa TaxID=1406 RepID=UPI001E2EE4FE